jgi:translation initiation factor 1 (eIF-1/SUI1)
MTPIMNFFMVFCKSRKKFDKYIKINRVRNKVIIDIKDQIEQEFKGGNYEKFRDHFNLIIYTKITQSLRKGKDIYYIPNFTNKEINIKEIFKIKEMFSAFDLKFNILLFYDEFKDDEVILNDVIENLGFFDSSQIIKDY